MKGVAIVIGAPKPGKGSDDGGGMDVEDEARRSALKAFMQAVQNDDLDAGMKAWARMGECGPPEVQSDGSADNEPDGESAPPKGRGLYKDE